METVYQIPPCAQCQKRGLHAPDCAFIAGVLEKLDTIERSHPPLALGEDPHLILNFLTDVRQVIKGTLFADVADDKAARDLTAARNQLSHVASLWQEACEHVAEACDLLGATDMPKDSWTLRTWAERVRRERDESVAREGVLRPALMGLVDALAGVTLVGAEQKKYEEAKKALKAAPAPRGAASWCCPTCGLLLDVVQMQERQITACPACALKRSDRARDDAYHAASDAIRQRDHHLTRAEELDKLCQDRIAEADRAYSDMDRLRWQVCLKDDEIGELRRVLGLYVQGAGGEAMAEAQILLAVPHMPEPMGPALKAVLTKMRLDFPLNATVRTILAELEARLTELAAPAPAHAPDAPSRKDLYALMDKWVDDKVSCIVAPAPLRRDHVVLRALASPGMIGSREVLEAVRLLRARKEVTRG